MEKLLKFIKSRWILFIVIVLIVYFLFYINIYEKVIKTRIEKYTIESINTILFSINDAYNHWYSDRVDHMLLHSKDQNLISLTENILRIPADRESLIMSDVQKEIREYFIPVLKETEDMGFFIINGDRINLSSARDENIGQVNLIHKQRPDILDEVFKGNIRLIPPVVSDIPLDSELSRIFKGYPIMFLAAPIFDENQNVIAVMTLRIDPMEDFSHIAALGCIGETGETYAFDKNAVLLTHRRFESSLYSKNLLHQNDSSIFNVRIMDQSSLTLMAENAINRRNGFNSDGYRNYRGHIVWGVWIWNDKLGFGLTTEIDESEALAVYNYISTLQRFGIITTSIFFFFLLFLFIIKHIQIKKHIQINEERLSIALNATNDFLIDYNIITEELYCNSLFEQNFGMHNKRINTFEEGFVNYIYPPDMESVIEKIKESQENNHGRMTLNFRLVNLNNEILWMQGRGQVLKDNKNPIRIILVLENITAQKKLEDELKKAKKEAEESIKYKSQLIQNVSHEIKTPLNSILGNLYRVQKTDVNVNQSELLVKIEKSSGNLLKIVNNMLNFSDSANVNQKIEFDLSYIMKSIFIAFKREITAKGLLLKFEKKENIPNTLMGDLNKLKIILTQLVDNAVKFTNEGSVILNIDLLESEYSKLKLKFLISDSGIGISDNDLLKIKKNFTQADGSEARKYEGIGIGLSITMEYLKLLKSDLKINSIFGKGTEISFIIDFDYPEENIYEKFILSNEDSIGKFQGFKEPVISTGLTTEIKEHLTELTRLCSANNLKALAYIESMKKNNMNSYFSMQWWNFLEESLSSYDFEKALELMGEIETVD